MALSESAKEAKHTNPKQEKSLVDLTAAAKSLKDPWGGNFFSICKKCVHNLLPNRDEQAAYFSLKDDLV